MAKGRKPAITGMARPEGFLDDVVRPIVQKGARKVQDIAGRHVAKQKGDKVVVAKGVDLARRKVVRSAYNFEKKVAQKRAAGYAKSGRKGYAKMEDAIERKYAVGMHSARNSRRIDAGAYKYVLNQKKEEALKSGRSVRKAAKDYRSKYPKRK